MNATEICNMALSFLAKGRINSMDEDSEEAKQCKIHYEHCRKRLLLNYPFGFARKEVKLAVLDPKSYPIIGWDYLYGYPEDTLSIQFVYDEEHARRKEILRQDFAVVMNGNYDRAIATDVKEAWAEVIADIKAPESFSEEFIDALAHMLAASMAMQLTGSANMQQVQLQLAQVALNAAMYQSVVEQERRTHFPRKYADARFS